MYLVEYYFDDMLDDTFYFKTEEKALEFYHKHHELSKRSYYNRFVYVGKKEEEVITWDML